MHSSAVLRAVALFLLFYTGADFIACDVAALVTCELGDVSDSNGGAKQDDCFCCCTHLVITTPDVLNALGPVSFPQAEPVLIQPSADRASIYHPPKA